MGMDERRATLNSDQCPTGERCHASDALPLLRQALREEDAYLVKLAASAIGKMKNRGGPAIDDLILAASQNDSDGVPQEFLCMPQGIDFDRQEPPGDTSFDSAIPSYLQLAVD
jgi:hypothetical protein